MVFGDLVWPQELVLGLMQAGMLNTVCHSFLATCKAGVLGLLSTWGWGDSTYWGSSGCFS